MADWNLPVASSLYTDVLIYLKARDVDAISLCFTVPTNIAERTIRYERTANLFQEWISGAWSNKVVSIAGGGTGANTVPGIITNLGLGSMALQAASNVNITGGSITGINPLVANNVSLTGGNIVGMNEIQGVNVRATAGGYLVGDGWYITNIQANMLSAGYVNTARLGSGTANTTTYLRGDSTWQPIAPDRWTPYYYYTHDIISVAQVNGMSLINYHGTDVGNIHLPAPNSAGIVAPYSAIRIMTWYGNAHIYGGHPTGPYADIGGRPSPFILSIPKMSVDLIPDPPTNTWNVF